MVGGAAPYTTLVSTSFLIDGNATRRLPPYLRQPPSQNLELSHADLPMLSERLAKGSRARDCVRLADTAR